MSKRKKIGSKTDSKTLVYAAWILGFIASMLASLVIGYYFGYDEAKGELQKKEQLREEKKASALKKLEESSVKKDDQDVNAVAKNLLDEHNIVIAARRGFLRISPHFYNTEDEIARLLELLP